MREGKIAAHPELWPTGGPFPESAGPEADYRMWREAETFFDHLYSLHEDHKNEAVVLALYDVYLRCAEERDRAGDLMALHDKWSRRGIGGGAVDIATVGTDHGPGYP